MVDDQEMQQAALTLALELRSLLTASAEARDVRISLHPAAGPHHNPDLMAAALESVAQASGIPVDEQVRKLAGEPR